MESDNRLPSYFSNEPPIDAPYCKPKPSASYQEYYDNDDDDCDSDNDSHDVLNRNIQQKIGYRMSAYRDLSNDSLSDLASGSLSPPNIKKSNLQGDNRGSRVNGQKESQSLENKLLKFDGGYIGSHRTVNDVISKPSEHCGEFSKDSGKIGQHSKGPSEIFADVKKNSNPDFKFCSTDGRSARSARFCDSPPTSRTSVKSPDVSLNGNLSHQSKHDDKSGEYFPNENSVSKMDSMERHLGTNIEAKDGVKMNDHKISELQESNVNIFSEGYKSNVNTQNSHLSSNIADLKDNSDVTSRQRELSDKTDHIRSVAEIRNNIPLVGETKVYKDDIVIDRVSSANLQSRPNMFGLRKKSPGLALRYEGPSDTNDVSVQNRAKSKPPGNIPQKNLAKNAVAADSSSTLSLAMVNQIVDEIYARRMEVAVNEMSVKSGDQSSSNQNLANNSDDSPAANLDLFKNSQDNLLANQNLFYNSDVLSSANQIFSQEPSVGTVHTVAESLTKLIENSVESLENLSRESMKEEIDDLLDGANQSVSGQKFCSNIRSSEPISSVNVEQNYQSYIRSEDRISLVAAAALQNDDDENSFPRKASSKSSVNRNALKNNSVQNLSGASVLDHIDNTGRDDSLENSFSLASTHALSASAAVSQIDLNTQNIFSSNPDPYDISNEMSSTEFIHQSAGQVSGILFKNEDFENDEDDEGEIKGNLCQELFSYSDALRHMSIGSVDVNMTYTLSPSSSVGCGLDEEMGDLVDEESSKKKDFVIRTLPNVEDGLSGSDGEGGGAYRLRSRSRPSEVLRQQIQQKIGPEMDRNAVELSESMRQKSPQFDSKCVEKSPKKNVSNTGEVSKAVSHDAAEKKVVEVNESLQPALSPVRGEKKIVETSPRSVVDLCSGDSSVLTLRKEYSARDYIMQRYLYESSDAVLQDNPLQEQQDMENTSRPKQLLVENAAIDKTNPGEDLKPAEEVSVATEMGSALKTLIKELNYEEKSMQRLLTGPVCNPHLQLQISENPLSDAASINIDSLKNRLEEGGSSKRINQSGDGPLPANQSNSNSTSLNQSGVSSVNQPDLTPANPSPLLSTKSPISDNEVADFFSGTCVSDKFEKDRRLKLQNEVNEALRDIRTAIRKNRNVAGMPSTKIPPCVLSPTDEDGVQEDASAEPVWVARKRDPVVTKDEGVKVPPVAQWQEDMRRVYNNNESSRLSAASGAASSLKDTNGSLHSLAASPRVNAHTDKNAVNLASLGQYTDRYNYNQQSLIHGMAYECDPPGDMLVNKQSSNNTARAQECSLRNTRKFPEGPRPLSQGNGTVVNQQFNAEKSKDLSNTEGRKIESKNFNQNSAENSGSFSSWNEEKEKRRSLNEKRFDEEMRSQSRFRVNRGHRYSGLPQSGGGRSQGRDEGVGYEHRRGYSAVPCEQCGCEEYNTDEETDDRLEKQFNKVDHAEQVTESKVSPTVTTNNLTVNSSPHNKEPTQQKQVEESKKNSSANKEVYLPDTENRTVLIEGVLFRTRYLGSTRILSDYNPSKAKRMSQAQECVNRIKSPDGESQPSTDVDLFISAEKLMVLDTDKQEVMMDHSLQTVSYIADIDDILVIMARQGPVSQTSGGGARSPAEEESEAMRHKRLVNIRCHVFQSDEAQIIAQSIGQAFQVAYAEFLKANGIEDPNLLKNVDYQEVLNQQQVFGEELNRFSKKEMQKEVLVTKLKGEVMGLVIVESGWGSMVPTVVVANLSPSGAAARCNQLNIGDQIMSVNGISMVGLPLSTCQSYIRATRHQTVVKLSVVHCTPVVEVLIRRPDSKYQLGFSVQNGVICSLLRGGIGERGGVRVGHRIIEINGQSMVAVPHDRIVHLLASSVGEIHMKTMQTSIYRLLTGQDVPHYI